MKSMQMIIPLLLLPVLQTVGQTTNAPVRVEKISEIQLVGIEGGYGVFKAEVSLISTAKLLIETVTLHGVMVDSRPATSEPLRDRFEIEANKPVRKTLQFRSLLSPNDYAALRPKFGGKVKVSGSASIFGSSTKMLRGEKIIRSETVFNQETTLIKPDNALISQLESSMKTGDNGGRSGGEGTDIVTGTPGSRNVTEVPNRVADELLRGMGSRVVIIESRAEANLSIAGKQSVSAYRHGFRISERRVLAPADLMEPSKLVRGTGIDSIIGSIASAVKPEIRLRAFLPREGQTRLESEAYEISFIKRLGGNGNFAVYELRDRMSMPTLSRSLSLAGTGMTGPGETSILRFSGLPESITTSATGAPSATLEASNCKVSGSERMSISPSVAATVIGAPVFNREMKLVGLMSAENELISAVALDQELTRSENAAPASEPSRRPTTAPEPRTQADEFILRIETEPAGATILVDGRPVIRRGPNPEALITPADVPLRRGTHKVTLVMADHETATREFDMNEDKLWKRSLRKVSVR